MKTKKASPKTATAKTAAAKGATVKPKFGSPAWRAKYGNADKK